MKKNSIGFRKAEHGVIDVNILICAFPPALPPAGQPSVALTPNRPAFRFPTSQNRIEPRTEPDAGQIKVRERVGALIALDQPIQHLQ